MPRSLQEDIIPTDTCICPCLPTCRLPNAQRPKGRRDERRSRSLTHPHIKSEAILVDPIHFDPTTVVASQHSGWPSKPKTHTVFVVQCMASHALPFLFIFLFLFELIRRPIVKHICVFVPNDFSKKQET